MQLIRSHHIQWKKRTKKRAVYINKTQWNVIDGVRGECHAAICQGDRICGHSPTNESTLCGFPAVSTPWICRLTKPAQCFGYGLLWLGWRMTGCGLQKNVHSHSVPVQSCSDCTGTEWELWSLDGLIFWPAELSSALTFSSPAWGWVFSFFLWFPAFRRPIFSSSR